MDARHSVSVMHCISAICGLLALIDLFGVMLLKYALSTGVVNYMSIVFLASTFDKPTFGHFLSLVNASLLMYGQFFSPLSTELWNQIKGLIDST